MCIVIRQDTTHSMHFIYSIHSAGGPTLHDSAVCESLFAAAAMHPGGPKKDFMDMKVTDLREELELRGEGKSGPKPWLRRRGCMRRLCGRT